MTIIEPPLKEKIRGKCVLEPGEILKVTAEHFRELAEIYSRGGKAEDISRDVSSKLKEIAGGLRTFSESAREDRGMSLGIKKIAEEFMRISDYLYNRGENHR